MIKGSIKGKCILCLINSAAYSRAYFERLTPYLERLGYRVVYALDSHLSDVLYADDRVLPGAWYFTDFLRERLARGWRPDADTPSWGSLFPDFDRFLTMGIEPPLRADGPLQYRDVPGALKVFFDEVFQQEVPDAVLYEPVSNSFAMAAYERACAFGIPFLSLLVSRIPGRIEISMTGALYDHETIGALYRASRSGAVSDQSRRVAEEYISSIDVQVPDYMKTNGLDRLSLRGKYLNARKIAHFLRGWHYRRFYAEDCALAYQHGDPVRLSMAYFRRSLKRRLRLSKVIRNYGEGVAGEKFFLYPLHFHPEASTSVWAQDYVEEFNVIQAIAFRLPTGVTLYVKEHPSAVALQPVSFYKKLSALPNVRLIAPEIGTKNLIRCSQGVVCLTSTVGFEAAVLNKPVITLGAVFYNYFPNVRNVSGYSEMAGALSWALDYQKVSAAELIEATAAYIEFGAPGRFDFRATLDDQGALQGVASLVAQRLEMVVGQKMQSNG